MVFLRLYQVGELIEIYFGLSLLVISAHSLGLRFSDTISSKKEI